MRLRALLVSSFLVAGVALSPLRVAHADDSLAAATVLFDEGVKLMDQGKYAEACPKLARSQALGPNGGTLLALGDCYEKSGRTASAWVAFREAATRAAAAGKRDAEASALERAKKLESTFPKLSLTVPPASQVQGLEVRRDGVVLKEAELGVAVPADPGTHEIQATAPHMKPFTKSITARAGETVDVPIPKLTPEPEALVEEAPPSLPPPPHGDGQRMTGVVIAAAGLASLIVGGFFALQAKSKNDEALQAENCPDKTHCTQHGLNLTREAKSRALVSTILVVIGAPVLAAGGIVFFTAPRAAAGGAADSRGRRIFVTPSVGLGSAGAAASVVW